MTIKSKNNHNYHDEIELTPNDQSYRLWRGAADQYTMSHGTFIHIMI